MMKKTLLTRGLVGSSLLLTACGNQEAITYNNTISTKTIELEQEISTCNKNLEKHAEGLTQENAAEKAEKGQECFKKIITNIATKKQTIKELGAFDGDDTFQKAGITYMDNAKTITTMLINLIDYRKNLKDIQTKEQQEKYMKQMTEDQQKIAAFGKKMDAAFATAQEDFAKKHKFKLKKQ